MQHQPRILSSALGLLLTATAQASIALNFGAISNPLFGTTGNLTQPYANVAPGINATLTAATSFVSLSPTNNGSVLGDIRINAANTTNVNITVALWDATAGNGYVSPYNPVGFYNWAFGFFDIDGGAGTYDIVTVHTPGTYTVTSTTALVITTGIGVSFSGIASPEIPGQGGITTLSASQADVAAIYTLSNTSSINFDYTVGVSGTPVADGRNLLIDGNDLMEGLTSYGPVTGTFIPEPSALMLATLGSCLLGLRRRYGAIVTNAPTTTSPFFLNQVPHPTVSVP